MKLAFGDIVANHWAGDANPGKRAIVLRQHGQYTTVINLDGRESRYETKSIGFEHLGNIFGKTRDEVEALLAARAPESIESQKWRHAEWHRQFDREYKRENCDGCAQFGRPSSTNHPQSVKDHPHDRQD